MKHSWFNPVLYLIRKEFQQIRRDPGMLRIIFVMPIVQLFIFGYAVNTDIRHVRLAVLDEDRTVESRSLVQAFFASDLFQPAGIANNAQELQEKLLLGDADITLWIRKNFERDAVTLSGATVGVGVDGQNSSLAGRALGYTEAILRRQTQSILDDWQRAHPEMPRITRIEPVTRYYYNPELQSRFYMIPGVVVMMLTMISTLLTGMAIVKEKEVGTLEQLMVTPITPLQMMVGKTIPFTILSYIALTVASTVAVLWYRLPLVGSVYLLAGSAMVFLLVTLGGGLLVSTISHTQQQAMFTIWFFMIFGILTSGFFYPIENMPHWVQTLTYVNPLRYFMAVVRGIFLRGATLPDLLPEILPLAALGAISFTAAAFRFRKTIS